jgi:hypothetical protein
MPNPWMSLRRDQLIPVNKAVNKKEQLEKGLEELEYIYVYMMQHIVIKSETLCNLILIEKKLTFRECFHLPSGLQMWPE